MVRQLEITTQGLPMEVYCFANDSKWEKFEEIQADILDRLLVIASQEFDLQIMQIGLPKDKFKIKIRFIEWKGIKVFYLQSKYL